MNKKELKANANVGVATLGDPHFGENATDSPTAYINSKSKIKTLTPDNKGITLIALVITIIVMLILVAVTVTVAINGGLFSTAKQATTDTQYHADREMLLSAVIGAIGSNAEVDFTELDENLPNGFTGSNGTYTSEAGNTFYVDKNGNITDGETPVGGDYKPVSELFDANGKDENAKGYDSNKLHIGDFINYTAGTWGDEITAIKVGKKGEDGNGTVSPNGKRELPNTSYQFGGFVAGGSKDGNAEPREDSCNGIKDLEGKEITGWRVFDVNEGTITLISAGCPEDFYVPSSSSTDSGNGGYISEYILSGSSARGMDLDTTYTKRDWKDYVNEPAISANAITKKDLDDWYKKYMGDNYGKGVRDTTTFQSVYNTRYENLIDNYSYYWLASAYNSELVCYVSPGNRFVSGDRNRANGVRVLITLKSDIQLSKSGTVTVNKLKEDTNHGGPYTYNVWNIQ